MSALGQKPTFAPQNVMSALKQYRPAQRVLTFFWRPTIGFSARAAHQHRSFTVTQTVSLQEGLDGLLVVDDGVCACPVRAPQAAVETPGIEHAGERIPDVRARDSVQAPLTLITAFLRLARSSTFGSSAHGCGGAGGARGCKIARWSMMKRVSG